MGDKNWINSRSIHLIIYAVMAVMMFHCSQPTSNEKADRQVKIVTTTGMLADAISHIMGRHATVQALMGPGVDPHLYKATQGDLKKLQEADIVVYNGLMLEGKMEEVLEKLRRNKTVIAAAALLPDSLLLRSSVFVGSVDPHIWFDVMLWKTMSILLSEKLIKTRPELSDDILRNTWIYNLQLDSLHQYTIESISRIPKKQRVLITAHDAFGYFGQAYDMEVKGLQGISTVSEFGLRDIANMIDLIESREIKSIFIETSVSEKSINAVLDGCRKKGIDVQLGGSLYSDAMGAEGTPEGTYIGMVKHNVATIVTALQ